MGAVGITVVKQGAVGSRRGNEREVEANINMSASYSTGGDTLSVATLGLKRVTGMSLPSHDFNTRKPVATTSTRSGLSYELGGTPEAPTIKAYDATAFTEVAAGTVLNGRGTVRVRFSGI